MKKLIVTIVVVFTATVVLSTTNHALVKPTIKGNMLSNANNFQKNTATAD